MKVRLKSNLHYIIFSIAFSTWLVSLLAIYLPMSRWGTPTFPVIIDNNILAIFLASTALSSVSSFLIGLDKLGKLPHAVNVIKQQFENLSSINNSLKNMLRKTRT